MSTRRQDQFVTTSWTQVVAAGDIDSPDAQLALETLCEAYWSPLYYYVRRTGLSPEDSLDATQGYFERLLNKNYLQDADRERGRFRSFLLASLKHYLANERRAERAQKRGGGFTFHSLDNDELEQQYQAAAPTADNPERLFDRQWAMVVIERALAATADYYDKRGKRHIYDALKERLVGDPTASCQAVAAELGISEANVKVTIHRMRERFRTAVKAEIAMTIADPSLVDNEFRALQDILSQ